MIDTLMPVIFQFHRSFTDDMHLFLGEALMWPVLIWLAWVMVQRATRKEGQA